MIIAVYAKKFLCVFVVFCLVFSFNMNFHSVEIFARAGQSATISSFEETEIPQGRIIKPLLPPAVSIVRGLITATATWQSRTVVRLAIAASSGGANHVKVKADFTLRSQEGIINTVSRTLQGTFSENASNISFANQEILRVVLTLINNGGVPIQ